MNTEALWARRNELADRWDALMGPAPGAPRPTRTATKPSFGSRDALRTFSTGAGRW
jgi:hypothetical protein